MRDLGGTALLGAITKLEITESETMPENKNDILVGLFFHSFIDDREVKWQGEILGRTIDGYLYVRIFDWIHGHESRRFLVNPKDALQWCLYETSEDMREDYEILSRQSKKNAVK